MSVKYPEHQSGCALNKADACSKFVVPKMQAAGWDNDPHSLAEKRYFTERRIIDHRAQAKRRAGKKADYILRLTCDFPIAVLEVKATCKNSANGIHQAKDYAQILDLRLANAANGESIVEFDFVTGNELELAQFLTL